MKDNIKHYLLLLVFLAIMAVILFLFHDFIDTYSNSLMVLITFVYVVATVEICRANIKSAEATREQLAESRRQYEDKKRLEIMPYIQFDETKGPAENGKKIVLALDSSDTLPGKYVIITQMKNIGKGTAKDIAYTYELDNGVEVYDRGAFPVQALLSGECQTIKVVFAHSTDEKEGRVACFIMRYKDLLENAYKQKVTFKFSRNRSGTLKLEEFTTSAPALTPKEEANA